MYNFLRRFRNSGPQASDARAEKPYTVERLVAEGRDGNIYVGSPDIFNMHAAIENTPHGDVVVSQRRSCLGLSYGDRFIPDPDYTVVPGLFVRELEPVKFLKGGDETRDSTNVCGGRLRAFEVIDTPESIRDEMSAALNARGYRGKVNYMGDAERLQMLGTVTCIIGYWHKGRYHRSL